MLIQLVMLLEKMELSATMINEATDAHLCFHNRAEGPRASNILTARCFVQIFELEDELLGCSIFVAEASSGNETIDIAS